MPVFSAVILFLPENEQTNIQTKELGIHNLCVVWLVYLLLLCGTANLWCRLLEDKGFYTSTPFLGLVM